MARDDRSKTGRLTRLLRSATRPLREAASLDTEPLVGWADAPTQPVRSSHDAPTRPVRGSANADTAPIETEWVDPAPGATPNLDKRMLLVLILDTSDSMSWSVANANDLTPISQLNAGLQSLRLALLDDSDARRRVEVAMITFGGTPVLRDLQQGGTLRADAGEGFVSGASFAPPVLTAGGVTPMAGAIELALDLVEARKNVLRAQGIPYFRPWLMVISDGEPTNTGVEWERAVRRIQQAQQSHQALVFPIGVENADMTRLNALIWNDPANPDDNYSAMKLEGLKFEDLFVWLTASVRETMSLSQDAPNRVMSRRRMWDQMSVT